MTLPPEGRVAGSRRYHGRRINVDLDTVRMPNGATVDLEIVRHPGAAAVVPLLSDAREPDPTVLLLRQYRYAAGGTLWEIPAGTLERNEEPLACARRELLEEAGARAERVEHLTTIYTTPGFTDERIHLFLATGITAGEPRPEADEFIQLEAVRLSRVLKLIGEGQITDAKSMVALLFVAQFRLKG
jgi:ADP-ribose pyrophosphatase